MRGEEGMRKGNMRDGKYERVENIRMGDGNMRTYSLPLLSLLVIGMGRPVATHGLSNKPKNIQLRLRYYMVKTMI